MGHRRGDEKAEQDAQRNGNYGKRDEHPLCPVDFDHIVLVGSFTPLDAVISEVPESIHDVVHGLLGFLQKRLVGFLVLVVLCQPNNLFRGFPEFHEVLFCFGKALDLKFFEFDFAVVVKICVVKLPAVLDLSEKIAFLRFVGSQHHLEEIGPDIVHI
ncbi:hypothetical protein SDC9_50605 [bioreactor metagenome]|uniref:Uncharacterized protein n=1 Tax=bioreactor metagenome TaxID=1076179 RepID=A0A644WLF1_9ZZZZ